MPDLPSDPTQMMALLNDLNRWLTRVNRAYEAANPDQKSVIETEVRLMLDESSYSVSNVVNWGGGPLPPLPPFVGVPCHLRATSDLDAVVVTIESEISHNE